jgi:hypothetical protein
MTAAPYNCISPFAFKSCEGDKPQEEQQNTQTKNAYCFLLVIQKRSILEDEIPLEPVLSLLT